MHLEIQVALNFFISHLYNKLPRRRVNLFGEELERALKMKFANHWYPDKPMKGSAYRCLKTGNPTDPVLERAALEANVSINDILENLPVDMSVWIDPGEVSYRVGEKGQMKVLWSEHSGDQMDELNADREVTKTFNPDAQIFQPIEAARKSVSPFAASCTGRSIVGASLTLAPSPEQIHPLHGSPFGSIASKMNVIGLNGAGMVGVVTPPHPSVAPLPHPTAAAVGGATNGWSPHTTTNQPQMMTTAAFAQTKFGSTKLKTSSKRTHRMSPTEFSNYIKQRAIQQQQQKAAQQQQSILPGFSRPRSLSPQDFGPFGVSNGGGLGYLMGGSGDKYNPFETAIWSSPSPTNNGDSGSPTGFGPGTPTGIGANVGPIGPNGPHPFDTNRQLLEGLNLGLNAVPYRNGGQQYQHLLVAN